MPSTQARKVVKRPARRPLSPSRVIQVKEALIGRIAKRTLDVVGASVASAVLLVPSMVLVAIIHRRHSRGPLLFRQLRTGKDGKVFQVYKFRSMEQGPDENSDPEVFTGGGFLRKYSIDELPQLINILKGDMSIVGPRPHPIEMDERLTRTVQDYHLRNIATPGLTGLAQAKGWRGPVVTDRDIEGRVRLDLFYITHWSFGLDLRIIWETLSQITRPPGNAR